MDNAASGIFAPCSFAEFESAIACVQVLLKDAPIVHTEKWQGYDIAKMPHMATRELLNVSFSAPIPTDLDILRRDVGPHLPWADDHFLERVGGVPTNPGEQWKNWPPGMKGEADKARVEEQKFSHTYQERYWPKMAGSLLHPLHGIRYAYGDLDDVVSLLVREPLTRQAFLPVWFPEDTGAAHRGRVPCSIGYQFILRDGKLNIVYWLRSCDFAKHFRDDIYLTARLLLWVLNECQMKDINGWHDIEPGDLTIHVISMHLFLPDHKKLFG